MTDDPTNNDDITASLLKFAPKQPPTPEQAERTGTKADYQAADVDRTGERARRIHVEQSNGVIRLISYSYFVEAIFTPADQILSFIYTNGALTIEGENLTELLPKLQTETVTALRPYDPDKHDKPEPSAPVITRMVWETVDQVLRRT